LVLRLPKSLHARLAAEAEADGMSLIPYLVMRLSGDSPGKGDQVNERVQKAIDEADEAAHSEYCTCPEPRAHSQRARDAIRSLVRTVVEEAAMAAGSIRIVRWPQSAPCCQPRSDRRHCENVD